MSVTSVRARPRLTVGAAIILGLLVVAVAAVLSRQPTATSAPTDPDSTSQNGSRALVNVLRGRGDITVDRVDRLADLESRTLTDTTLVVSRADLLTRPVAERLRAVIGRADRVVLVTPDETVLAAWGLAVTEAGQATGRLPARCSTPDVEESEEVLVTTARMYEARTSSEPLSLCFLFSGTTSGAPTDAEPAGVVASTTLPAGTPVTVLGSEDLITNEGLVLADNAAIAVRALGHSGRVLWYLPDSADLSAVDPSPATPVPEWFTPGLLIVGAAGVLLVLWRGRRLGRLVVEPLPVVVRAAESTLARGRLYRRADEPSRAAAILATSALARLNRHLHLPAGTSVATTATAVAEATGRPVDEVLALLTSGAAETPGTRPTGRPPITETTLVDIARRLHRLETEVRHR